MPVTNQKPEEDSSENKLLMKSNFLSKHKLRQVKLGRTGIEISRTTVLGQSRYLCAIIPKIVSNICVGVWLIVFLVSRVCGLTIIGFNKLNY